MKIKVDKGEYEHLLKRVKELEDYRWGELQRIARLAHDVERHMEDFSSINVWQQWSREIRT